VLAQVFTAFKYLESNIGLLLLSFFIQVSFYSIGGYYLISVFGIETLQSHTPLIFATLAVSLSIRINIVYLKEMLLGDIKFNGRLNLIKFGGLRHLFYVGRTTKQRFFCFMLFGSILSLFEISNWDLSFLMLDFLKVEKTEIFYLRWVVLLLTLNGIVTTAGKLISLIEDVKNSSFFSHAFFAVCTGSIATLFFAESELFKVTLVLLITYTTIIVSFIHDQIRREKSNISLLLA
jgi:hypothetical protein